MFYLISKIVYTTEPALRSRDLSNEFTLHCGLDDNLQCSGQILSINNYSDIDRCLTGTNCNLDVSIWMEKELDGYLGYLYVKG